MAAVTAAQQHSTLRGDAFNRRVALKAVNFLQLRTLPQLDQTSASESILQRERSGLYRR